MATTTKTSKSKTKSKVTSVSKSSTSPAKKAVTKAESKKTPESVKVEDTKKVVADQKTASPSKPKITPPPVVERKNTSNSSSSNNSGKKSNSQRGNVQVVNGRRVWRSSAASKTNSKFGGMVDGRRIPDADVPTEVVTGYLDMMRDGNGVLRSEYSQGDRDAYISGTQIRRFRLKPGDKISGPARQPKDKEQYWGLLKVETINGHTPEQVSHRVRFERLTPVYPDDKIIIETDPKILSTRMIDLVAPVGRGQRGMIVSPPKAGKTTIIKDISTGIAKNYKDIHLMAVLIGERPEEVTDIRRHIESVTGGTGEVAASNFDEQAQEQVRVSELALERAKRMVEMGRHVVVLLDSITRLARAYNLAMPTSGRTLSGGFDPAALYPPKRFFGAARNFEEFETPDGKQTGSLTILGTALTDTGSRMDDLIYEEFKGTGNMELHLDRELAERRIFPAIDVQRSGTRREDLLFSQAEYQSIVMMRRMIDMLDPRERTAVMVGRMKNTKNNKEFLATLKEG